MLGRVTTGLCLWGVSDVTGRLWPSETASDMMLAVILAAKHKMPLCHGDTVQFDGPCASRTRMGRGKILDRLVADGMVVQRREGRRVLSIPTSAGLSAWRMPLPDDRSVYRLFREAGTSVSSDTNTLLGRSLRRLWRRHYAIGVEALRDLAPLGYRMDRYTARLWAARDTALVEAVLDGLPGLHPYRVRKLLIP